MQLSFSTLIYVVSLTCDTDIYILTKLAQIMVSLKYLQSDYGAYAEI